VWETLEESEGFRIVSAMELDTLVSLLACLPSLLLSTYRLFRSRIGCGNSFRTEKKKETSKTRTLDPEWPLGGLLG